MAVYPWTDTVTIRGKRGNHTHFARNLRVFIWRLGNSTLVDESLVAARWKYGIKWYIGDTLEDGSAISEGDVLLWAAFPNQELVLGEAFVDPGAGSYRVMGAYFMPVDQAGPRATTGT